VRVPGEVIGLYPISHVIGQSAKVMSMWTGLCGLLPLLFGVLRKSWNLRHGNRVSVVVAMLAFVVNNADALGDERAKTALSQLPSWRTSVVLIRVTCSTSEPPYLGTGVVVGDSGLVMSAAHVGNACPSVTEVTMGAVRSPYAGPRAELAAVRIRRRVDGEDEEPSGATKVGWYEDLALYQISNMTSSGLTPARISPDYPVPGDEVTIVGFAGLPYWYKDAPPSSPGLTVFKTTLVSVAANADDVPYRLHYTGATLPRVSGGPVFNKAGELLGIHSGRVTRGSGGVAVVDNYSWATSVLAAPPSWGIPQ
jgi:S1-C subfamily serine protease